MMRIERIGDCTLYGGDMRDVLAMLPENSVDSIVCDPPYHLTSIVKRFAEGAPAQYGKDGAFQRASAGFMGKQWDGGDIAFQPETWAACLRVLKPGGHVVAFSGTRTYHRMAVAIEDAGFEIRDQLAWMYGSGFPKSHDVSKAIDKIIKRVGMFGPFAEHYEKRRKASGLTHNAICAAGGFFAEHNHGGASTNWEKGHNVPTLSQWQILQPLLDLSDDFLPLIERAEAEREKIGERKSGDPVAWFAESDRGGGLVDITLPGTAESAQWQGWGTALKPAWEPICLARKPLIGTVAANVLEHGTGAINIDGCRVETDENLNGGAYAAEGGRVGLDGDEREGAAAGMFQPGKTAARDYQQPVGRWPANLIHDGSDEVLAGFPEAPGQQRDIDPDAPSNKTGLIYGKMNRHGEPSANRRYAGEGGTNFAALPGIRRNDSGSAARFFYCAKASRNDREEGLEELASVYRVNGNKWTDQDYRVSRGERPPSAESGPRKNIHPTVKPTALMEYLVRLVTPPGGTVLDPFMGSGSTGKACVFEGFKFIGIEREAEYLDIAKARIAWAANYKEPPLPVAAQAQPANVPDNDNDLPLFRSAA